MTQYAIIKKLTGPEKAEVEVLRGTACGDDGQGRLAALPENFSGRTASPVHNVV